MAVLLIGWSLKFNPHKKISLPKSVKRSEDTYNPLELHEVIKKYYTAKLGHNNNNNNKQKVVEFMVSIDQMKRKFSRSKHITTVKISLYSSLTVCRT